MPQLPAGGRLQWTDLPNPLRARLQRVLGAAVTDASTAPGGFGHQLAAAVTLANGRRVFVKAAPDLDPLTTTNLHEAAVLGALPPGAPAAGLVGVHRAGYWTALVVEHLQGPHIDLSSDDAGRIWTRLKDLASAPASPAYREAVGTTAADTMCYHGWAELAAEPPDDLAPFARAHLSALAEWEASWPDRTRGDRIVHGDLRADNAIHDRNRGVVFVDWAQATVGQACIDAVSLAPQLVLAGHGPITVARLLQEHPATATDPDAVTAFLAALTGHWHRNARLPEPPHAPGLRAYQRRTGAAGLALLAERLK